MHRITDYTTGYAYYIYTKHREKKQKMMNGIFQTDARGRDVAERYATVACKKTCGQQMSHQSRLNICIFFFF